MIDFTGSLRVKADLDSSKLGARDTEVLERVAPAGGTTSAPYSISNIRETSTLGEQLLARLFVLQGSPGAGHTGAGSPALVTYNTVLSMRPVVQSKRKHCAEAAPKTRHQKTGPGDRRRERPFVTRSVTRRLRQLAQSPRCRGGSSIPPQSVLRDWTGWLGREDSNS